jgi:hypothetical protein
LFRATCDTADIIETELESRGADGRDRNGPRTTSRRSARRRTRRDAAITKAGDPAMGVLAANPQAAPAKLPVHAGGAEA